MRAGAAGSARRRGTCTRRCRCPGRRGCLRCRRPRRCGGSSSSTRWPGTDVSRSDARLERVAQVLRDVLQRPDVEVRRGVLDGVLQLGCGVDAHTLAFVCGCLACATAEDDALEQRVAHHAVAPVRAARDLAAGVDTLERRLGVRVDDEAAVLVVEDGVREDLLRERVDAARAVTAKHVRQAELGVVLGDARRVEVDGGAAVGRLDALALRDLVDDRLRDDVARAERVGELLAVGVQEDGAVRARRLGDAVALHRLGPRAAVRVVLQRVEVARLGAGVERDARHLAGRAGMVRRELAALLGLGVAAAAGGEDHGRRRRASARRRARASRARPARAPRAGSSGRA